MVKRSISITIFGYLNLIPGLFILLMSFLVLLLEIITNKINIITLSSFLEGVIIGLITFLCGIGLLRLKKWGLKLFIWYNVWVIGYALYTIWYRLYHPSWYNTYFIGRHFVAFAIVSIIFWLFVIWLFTRKKIVEQFSRE
jgi:hypothetical protein